MKTRVTVEINDRVRFVIGQLATGEPHLASREEVEAFYSTVMEKETVVLELAADRQRDAVKAALNLEATPKKRTTEE